MHAFQKDSENYEFELKNKDLYITSKDRVKAGLSEVNIFTYTGDIQVERRENLGSPGTLIIENFLEVTQTNKASTLINDVLTSFFDTFKPQGDQRDQLRKGLRYFALADHYGLFKAAFPNEVLAGVKEKYEELVIKLSSLENEHKISKELITKFHINEPLIASTGLVVYAALNDNWYIFETDERNQNIPEYLCSVIHHTQFKMTTSLTPVFTGSQNDCLNYVKEQQRKIYGISLDEFKSIEHRIKANHNLASDFEVLLNMPYDQTLVGKAEIAARQQAIDQSVNSQIDNLNLINPNKE